MTFRFYTLDDDLTPDRMHGRYLFSINGGIRVDRGFEEDKKKELKTEVSPIGEAVLSQLVEKYLTRAGELPIEECIQNSNQTSLQFPVNRI